VNKLRLTLILIFSTVISVRAVSLFDDVPLLTKSKPDRYEELIQLIPLIAKSIKQSPDRAFAFIKKADDIITTQSISFDDSTRLELQYLKGEYYSRIQQYDSAVLILNQTYQEALKAKEFFIAAKSIGSSGIACESLGDYNQASLNYFEALKIFERIKNSRGMMGQYLNLGLIYFYQKNYRQAEYYFLKAQKSAEILNDKNTIISAYNNLGLVLIDEQKPLKALEYFNKVLNFDLSSGDSFNIADSYNNVGVVYQKLTKYDLAEKYFLQSAQIKKRLGDVEGYCNTNNNLAEIYLLTNQMLKADIVLLESEQLAIPKKLKSILVENYRIRHEWHVKQKNYKAAYHTFYAYASLKDSLKYDELNLQLEKLQKQHELQKSAKEISEKNLELGEQKFKQRIFISILISIVVFFIVVLINYYRVKSLHSKLEIQQQKIMLQNQDLIKSNIEIIKSKKIAEEAARAKANFLSIMSHEIRTPLNAIVGLSNILFESKDNHKNKEHLEILKDSSAHLLGILNDVLDLSKIEEGKVEIQQQQFNLNACIHRIAQLFRYKANEKGLDIHIDFDEQIPTQVISDELHLTQVLTNLLSNAIKFTHQGTVTILTELINRNQSGVEIRLCVKDTGIGIPIQHQQKIFEPFTQADTNTTRAYGGSGLGLSISTKLLQLMGTKLQLKSEEGVGSCFYFHILMRVAEAAEGSEKVVPTMDKSILKDKRILLAEDNTINVHVIKQFLTKWELTIQVAGNGKEAVELYKTQPFDLVLMDLYMPEMDGIEATKEILKINPAAKILALTATHESEIKEIVKSTGMKGYIMKPFQPDNLLQVLSQQLSA
jgi:signal transduction histidine kinase